MKLLRTLCALLAVCVLAACGQTAELPEATDFEEELIVVGFCQTGAESDWRVANSESIQAEFTESNGYRLLFVNAQQKQENQIRAIRSFIQQQVDYIVFCPLTEDGWTPVLTEAAEAGIPVVVTDRQVKVPSEELYTAFVGSDFVSEGRHATEWLRSYLKAERPDLERVRIVELLGTLGSSPQRDRAADLEQAAAVTPAWELTQLGGDFTTAKAQETMTQYLAEAPPPDVLVCQNDDMALEQSGGYCGTRPGQVLLISFDATNAGLQACLAGKIAFDVECNPLQGPLVR